MSHVLALLLVSSLCFAQIPNGDFEAWADDGGGNINPVGWETTNSFPTISVEQFTPAHQGNFAMKVKTVSLGGMFTLPGVAILEAAISLSETPVKLGAWVRSTIMPGDTAFILVGLLQGETVVAATDSCTFKIDSSYAQFTYLEFPLAVLNGLVPDSLYLMVTTGLVGSSQVGTEIIVDDFEFIGGGPTAVSDARSLPSAFGLDQNYPNPFNGETVISYQVSAFSHVRLQMYDLLGRVVATLVDEAQQAGPHKAIWKASEFPSGIYFYRLEARGYHEVRKMVFLR